VVGGKKEGAKSHGCARVRKWVDGAPAGPFDAARFEGSTPSWGSRVSINHRHCLASSVGRLHPLWMRLTCIRCRKRCDERSTISSTISRSTRLSLQEARFPEIWDTSSYEAVPSGLRGNACSEMHFLNFILQLFKVFRTK